MTDHEVAARLATAAGNLLLGVRAELAEASPAERKDAGDKRSHEFLMDALAAERPGDAVLSEEAADNPVRLAAGRVWIVDPLDGTREFGDAGRTDWAVHVALWARDAGNAETGDLIAGAVALPAQNRVLATVAEPGRQAEEPPHSPLRIAVSRSRASDLVKDVAARIQAELVPVGSAGAKVATVVMGENDVYLHSGGSGG